MLSYLPRVTYLGLVGILVFTGTGFPIPEEVPVVLAGIASNPGYLAEPLNPWLALLSCICGSVGGDCVMYFIGYRWGHSALREHRLVARFIRPEREEQIERMIRRHGFKVFFLARFLVGLRSPVFLAAGILRVPFRRFLLVDLVSVTAVVTCFFGLSYYFADHIVEWWKWIRGAEYTLTVLVVAAAASIAWVWYRRHRERAQRFEALRRARANRTNGTPGPPTAAGSQAESTV